jgi:hypothetical protein
MLAQYLLRRMSTLIGAVNECCEISRSRNIDYKSTIVCEVTPYSLVYIYHCFRETCLILLRLDDSLHCHHTTSALYNVHIPLYYIIAQFEKLYKSQYKQAMVCP